MSNFQYDYANRNLASLAFTLTASDLLSLAQTLSYIACKQVKSSPLVIAYSTPFIICSPL